MQQITLFYKYLFISIIFCCFNIILTDDASRISNSKISVNGHWFVDEFGRVKIFHGLNAVQKGFPWVPVYGHNNLTNATHLNLLKSWGFNAMRVG